MTKLPFLLAAVTVAATATPAAAQRVWVEAKGPNVTVLSDAGEGRVRDIAWQFEQVREAMVRLFPWTRPRASKPLIALAARNEAAMRELVPSHYEQRRDFILGSMSVIGYDRAYVALRADLRSDDREGMNPYENAFWGYAAQALSDTSAEWPTWLLRGLASVISNTLVRDKEIQLGRILPQHVTLLRTRARLPLKEIVSVVSSDDPRMKRDGVFEVIDAQAWAFVHFLIWADKGAHQPLLDQYVKGLLNGANPVTSLASSLGDVTRFETAFNVYVNRDLFGFTRFETSARLSREGFVVRDVPPAESLVVRAAFHAAMGRPEESRALVAEAQRVDGAVGDEVVALLAERDNRDDEVRGSLEKAATQKHISWYTPYRLATLLPGNQDEAVRARIETLLKQATALNPNADVAWAFLGEVQAALGRGDVSLAAVNEAIQLMPSSSRHHASLAQVYRRLNRPKEALTAAGRARALARTTAERDRAQTVLGELASETLRAAEAAATPATAEPALAEAPASASAASSGPPVDPAELAGATADARDGEIGELVNACFTDNRTCRKALPDIAGDCNGGASPTSPAACRNAGYILDVGLGMPASAVAAADFYRKGCARKDEVSCVRLATLQAQGRGVRRDVAAALSVLDASCKNDVQEACFRLGMHLSSTKTPADAARARQILSTSCTAGFTESCAWLAKLPPP